MTKYYLEVLIHNLSICVDSDIGYHHLFKIGDVITIHMYSSKSINVVIDVDGFGSKEYHTLFTLDWDKIISARLSIASCIRKGYLVDVTKNVNREEKLKALGI